MQSNKPNKNIAEANSGKGVKKGKEKKPKERYIREEMMVVLLSKSQARKVMELIDRALELL